MDIHTIVQRLKENEALARKFHEIETSILTIFNYQDLFEELLDQIQLKFGVPLVWLSIIKDSEVSKLAERLSDKEIWCERINIIERKDLSTITAHQMTPRLINRNIASYASVLPGTSRIGIKSLAIAPISLDGKLIGSLNQGDPSPTRFHPGLDTSLLERLALKVSLCFSNVTAHEKLRSMAFYDPLTGLLNRRAMDNALKREFSRAIRYHRPLSVVFIDLNNFKIINDTYGHETGDGVLKYLASILMQEKRETDIIARFAGDEFVAVLADTSFDEADLFMRRIKTLIHHPLFIAGVFLKVRFSYGVASTQQDIFNDAYALLKAADTELYRVKQSNKKG